MADKRPLLSLVFVISDVYVSSGVGPCRHPPRLDSWPLLVLTIPLFSPPCRSFRAWKTQTRPFRRTLTLWKSNFITTHSSLSATNLSAALRTPRPALLPRLTVSLARRQLSLGPRPPLRQLDSLSSPPLTPVLRSTKALVSHLQPPAQLSPRPMTSARPPPP